MVEVPHAAEPRLEGGMTESTREPTVVQLPDGTSFISYETDEQITAGLVAVNELVALAEHEYETARQSYGLDDGATLARQRVLENARRRGEFAKKRAAIRCAVSKLDPGRAYEAMLGDETRAEHAQAATPARTVYLPEPVDWRRLLSDEEDDEQYLLEPLLVAGRSHALYAPAKTGKSLLILEAVIALATGGPFLHQPAGQPIDVLYLDYEMTRSDLRARVTAMGQTAGDLDHLQYFLIPALDPLDTAAGGHQVETLAARHHAQLIVIDTTARAIEGEENSADTLRALYRHTGARLKAAGITVVRVDHAGKDISKGQRGTSAKNDDVDIVWQLTGAGDRLSLKCTHQRVGYLPPQVELRRSQEPLEHKIIEDRWPAGTAELADRLDKLGQPVDVGRPKASAAIAEWNQANPHDLIETTARLVEAAVKYRKSGLRRQTLEDISEAA